MKKLLIFTLCLVMIITCFTACKQDAKPTTPESKTDVSTPAVVDQQPKEEVQAEADVSEPAQKEEKEPVQQSDDEQEETEPVSKVESKPTSKVETKPASKSESKPTSKVESQPTTSQNQEDDNYAEPIFDIPKFENENQLKQWLVGGKNGYEQEHAQIVDTMVQSNRLTYYQPKLYLKNEYQLKQITIERNSCWSFSYERMNQENKSVGNVGVSVGGSGNGLEMVKEDWERIKKLCEGDHPNHFIVEQNEIPYYCHKIDSMNYVYVCWQQSGKYVCCHIDGCLDDFNEILPLLELEQVTVKLNDDAVIK